MMRAEVSIRSPESDPRRQRAAAIRALLQVPPLYKVVTFGQDPSDDDRTRRLKTMAVIVAVVMTLFSASMLFVPERSLFLRRLDVLIVAAEVNGLFWYWRIRTAPSLFYLVVPPYFAFMAFSALINGTTEGDHFAIMLIPTAAVVILGPDRALGWLAAALATLFAVYSLDPYLPHWTFESVRSVGHPDGSLFHSAYKQHPTFLEMETTIYATILFFFITRSAYIQLTRMGEQIKAEKAKVDQLMDAVYPASVSERLKVTDGQIIADDIPEASVLYADLEGFSRFTKQNDPQDVVAFLDAMFGRFDMLAEHHGVEKIKTIGDGYLAASGVLAEDTSDAADLCALGLDMIHAVQVLSKVHGVSIGVRIGIHTGPVMAGVMGRKRPHFDIWGGTVNMAHRLQATAPRNTIQISEETCGRVAGVFDFKHRGDVRMKGLGFVPCWTLKPTLLKAAA
ncbi:adenylate/guanylate cyclase domain-containing protein [Donghicola tyrosinivorans]|uniref:Class 3 adenylate cyclase n=1 Tax=Donghicola tyrosinivorans TaxID=1652492 RepID=A0A2T0WEJ0_9RHOB|nr:adenylate/guanylate cyclase domain-containing protein [Donghicola tyrosinivorans]PRY85076.1 class 3 adenylate cyclase [Donghicola tyrosinivorans]